MPRKAREKSNTKVYHVIIRGNAKQDIFLEKQDYEKFIKEICNTKEKYQYELYAYCLMTNHVHFIIYDKNEKLSKILQSLTVSYSSYWNKKYDREGHLFQNRFLSKNIEFVEFHKTNLEGNKMKDLIEYEMIEKLNDEQARQYIVEILQIKDIQKILQYNLKERNECLRKLKNIRGISNLQIARITGLSKRMVEVAMK